MTETPSEALLKASGKLHEKARRLRARAEELRRKGHADAALVAVTKAAHFYEAAQMVIDESPLAHEE